MSLTRQLALALLSDEHGISTEAYDIVSDMLAAEDGNEDILKAVKATDGRFYLPEDFQSNH